jgi:hypothetical protein
MDRINMGVEAFNPVITVVAGGIIGGISLFVGHIALDKYRMPHLSVDTERLLEPSTIDLYLCDIKSPYFPAELREVSRNLKVSYNVNRVTIKNDRRYAAENCKGMLKINNREEKISWHIPTETYKMTVNGDSEEYLDVCAVIAEDSKKAFERAQTSMKNEFGSSGDVMRTKKEIGEVYKTHEDIPSLISPTENGWSTDLKQNRKISPGNATVVVTAKNMKPSLKHDITIHDKPLDNKGRVISFSKNKD